MINVSWDDAVAYAKWLTDQTGLQEPKHYRLPSEAEWEYAARARMTTNYWWGDDINQNDNVWANCDGCGDNWDYTAPVGEFSPNPYGLYDTAGNVWEWIQDCYLDSYQGAPTDGKPWETTDNSDSDCSVRVLRGGSWNNKPNRLRSANRNRNNPDNRNNNYGFRLASSPACCQGLCPEHVQSSRCPGVSEAPQRVSMASPSGLSG